MDAVFKALADPTRRELLDRLFEQDGQTLGQLEADQPMTRFGVMKHLRVLEDARLITTRRRGREKLHFLNAVPIQQIHERWVSKYAQPWAATLTGSNEQQRRTNGSHRDHLRRAQLRSRRRPWDVHGIRDLHQRHPGARVGGDHRSRDAREVQLRRGDAVGLDARFVIHGQRRRRDRDLQRGKPRGRSAAPARPDLHRAVERRGEGRRRARGSHGSSSRSASPPC